MNHEMKLMEGPFERIKKNIKVLELRLFDEKRRQIRLGDTIEFSKLPQLIKKTTVEVIGLLIYPKFSQMIMDLPAAYLGYQESDKDYLKDSMYEIYSKAEETEYGALGIRIKLKN